MTELLIRDALAAVAWGTVNLLLAVVGWRLSRRVAPGDPPTARILHVAVFAWSTIIGVATLLGLCHALTPLTLLTGVAAAAVVAFRYGAGGAVDAPVTYADRAVLVGWLALLAYWIGCVIQDGLLRFPTDWDSLMYHIPLIDQWHQAGSLYAPRDAVWYNPGNNELMGLWMVAPFSGDFLIGLNNLPAITLLSLGSVELARQVGRGRLAACVAGLAVVATLVVSRQLVSAENDMASAGLLMASVCYALRHARSGGSGDLLLGAATVGLLAGVKYYALGYGFAAGATLVLGALLARGPRAAARTAMVGILAALVFGGYWYLRNAWLTGTPIYPKGYDAETDVMSGWRPDIWSSSFLGSGRAEVLPLAVSAVRRMVGPCYLIAFVFAPAVAGWLAASGLWWWRRGDLGGAGSARVALALALIAAGLVWGCIPFTVETWPPGSLNALTNGYIPVRFGLSFLSLAVVALAVVLHDLGSGLAGLAARLTGGTNTAVRDSWFIRALALLPVALFGAAALHQFFRGTSEGGPANFASSDNLMTGLNVGLAFALSYLCWQSWPERRRTMAVGAAIGLLVAGAVVAEKLAQRWHAGFTPFYERLFSVPTYSQLAARDPATTNICALHYRYYPCFGSRRQYRVARPVWVPTYPQLRDYLRTHECTVVVAALGGGGDIPRYTKAAGWLAEWPGVFSEAHSDRRFIIFEVDRVQLERLEPERKPLDP